MHAVANRANIDVSSSTSTVSDPQTRDDLLLMATERFCNATDHDRLSTEHYKEAFYLLIGAVNSDTKQKVAQKISRCDYIARSIVLFFALEPLPIATPVLHASRTLGQLDLLRIVEMKGEDHSAILAARPDIGPNAYSTFEKIKQHYCKYRSRRKLCTPADMKEQSVESMFAHIKNISEISPATTIKTETTNAEQRLLTAAARGGKLDVEVKNTRSKPLAIENFGRVLERAASTKSRQAMVVLMQKQSGLHAQTAHQVLDDKSGDTLAVFLRAADVSAAQANRIQMLSQPAIGLSVQNAARAARYYAKLSKESCLTAIEQWPKQKDNGYNYEGFTEEGSTLRTEITSSPQPKLQILNTPNLPVSLLILNYLIDETTTFAVFNFDNPYIRVKIALP